MNIQIYRILFFTISASIAIIAFDRFDKLSRLGGSFPFSLPFWKHLICGQEFVNKDLELCQISIYLYELRSMHV